MTGNHTVRHDVGGKKNQVSELFIKEIKTKTICKLLKKTNNVVIIRGLQSEISKHFGQCLYT